MTKYNFKQFTTFKEYIDFCQKQIFSLRAKQSGVEGNLPYEFTPSLSPLPQCGVLLVHGLFDSPFTMLDIAKKLAEQHIAYKSILLPGHGTDPEDLMQTRYQEWVDAVDYGIKIFAQEVQYIFIIGFSTGATLGIYHALKQANIAGIILIAPALKIKTIANIIIWFYELCAPFRASYPWIYRYPEIDYVKYQSYSWQPVIQINQLASEIRQLAKHNKLTCPMFMISTEDDETISHREALNFYHQHHHKNNVLWIYSKNAHVKSAHPNIHVMKKSYPELNISSISHIALPFSAENSHYGAKGDYVHASHFDPAIQDGAFNRIQVEFSKWRKRFKLMKQLKRTLTYNPNFEQMANEIISFIQKNCS